VNWLRCSGAKRAAPFEYCLERHADFLSVKNRFLPDDSRPGAMHGDFTYGAVRICATTSVDYRFTRCFVQGNVLAEDSQAAAISSEVANSSGWMMMTPIAFA
jgi:hypothetical protein